MGIKDGRMVVEVDEAGKGVSFFADSFASFFFHESFFSRCSRCGVIGFSSDFTLGGGVCVGVNAGRAGGCSFGGMGSAGACSAMGRRGPFWVGREDWGRGTEGIEGVETGAEKDGFIVLESICYSRN